ncbi:MAG TPA: hypothetical protein VFS20_15070 [Longimicrobium sp.]|nr:hypothetical protein [Longimicrobium sp.]
MNQSFDGAARVVRRGASLLLLGTFLLQGCYSVSAVDPGGPQPGTRLVASLTPDGSQQLASQVGPRVIAVEGVLDEATADRLSLRLVRTEGANQISTYWNQEEVTIPRPAIAQLRQRRLDRTRSYLAAGAIVGGALFIASLAGGVFASDDGPGPGPPPPN